jgi:hypothetical protein
MPAGAPPPGEDDLAAGCRAVLEAAWDAERGYCCPHASVYPHQWLWDSAFHAVAWAAIGDARGAVELGGIFDAQLDNGFVPHMRYAGDEMYRGPLPDSSSYTQPPVYVHAVRALHTAGVALDYAVVDAASRGVDYLWEHRRGDDGLIFIVHPWEAGSDDSPRWDSWVRITEWSREDWTAFDLRLVPATWWSEAGDAVWSDEFVVAPAGFNALVAHALAEHAAVTGDIRAAARSQELSAAIDRLLWDPAIEMWIDHAVVGGGASCTVPTLDGVLPALVTTDPDKAAAALDQLWDESRFSAPFGPTFVWRRHPKYRSDGYWRGAVWPQLAYLTWLAAHRWGRTDLALHIADTAVAGTVRSGFSEYWDAETGEACGATPQTWAAIAAAYERAPLLPEIRPSA